MKNLSLRPPQRIRSCDIKNNINFHFKGNRLQQTVTAGMSYSLIQNDLLQACILLKVMSEGNV